MRSQEYNEPSQEVGSNAAPNNITNDSSQPYQNKTIFQGFEWYLSGTTILQQEGGDELAAGTRSTKNQLSGVIKDVTYSHWQYLTSLLPQLSFLGITSIWIPPACKATWPKDEGYGIYDLYDLGEFNTKGSIGTKWGTKDELKTLCSQAEKLGIGIVFDAVLNHRAAADGSEEVSAIRVDLKNRTKEIDIQPKIIEAWTRFNYDARNGKYSNLRYNKDHFSAVDWCSRTSEKAIFKFVGTRLDGTKRGWAKDVELTENGNYDYLMFADLDYGNAEVQQDVKKWGRWLLDELPGVRGMRLDAIKHYSADFQKSFIEHLKKHSDANGNELFFVGEYWLPDSKFLSQHIDRTFAGQIHLFDVKLLYNFYDVSRGRLRDLRKVFAGSLVELQPQRAITFVANHDTQEGQSLAAPIEPWFIPHAYALILLRQEGHPCVFWGDVYGNTGPNPRVPACGGRLVRLIKARQLFAYGDQADSSSSRRSDKLVSSYQDASCIAWFRHWHSSNYGQLGLVVLLSISWSWRKKTIKVGTECSGQVWTDIMGWSWSGVLIDDHGYGEFPVGPRSISVWTWKDAPGRTDIDRLVYPPEPPVDSDMVAGDATVNIDA